MAKVYPLEIKLEAAVEKTTRELLLWIRMMKLYFFKPPKAKEWWQYCFTRGMWLLFVVALVFAWRV